MKTIKEYKKLLIGILEDAGVPDTSITLKEPKESKNNWLGWYRGKSQFGRNAIIYLDINAHVKALEDSNSPKEMLEKVIIDTLLHEYGHVIEEFITVDSIRKNDKTILNEINSNFDDMEDFAELFAKYINQDSYLRYEQEVVFKKVISYYKEEVFTEEAINWVNQPSWKRELDVLIKKFNEKVNSTEDSLNKVLIKVDFFYEKFSEKSDVQILKLKGYKGSLRNAYSTWQNVNVNDKDLIIHYVLKSGDTIIDLNAKQFNSLENCPKIQNISELSDIWSQIELFKSKKIVAISRLKM